MLVFYLQNHSRVNPAKHQHTVFQFDLTDCFGRQTTSRRIDSTRLQRASKGARKSTCRGSYDVIERGRTGLGNISCHVVMHSNRSVDAKRDGLRLGGKMCLSERPFDSFDPDLGPVDDCGHQAPLLDRFVL
jgi:hypothetical protein